MYQFDYKYIPRYNFWKTRNISHSGEIKPWGTVIVSLNIVYSIIALQIT